MAIETLYLVGYRQEDFELGVYEKYILIDKEGEIHQIQIPEIKRVLELLSIVQDETTQYEVVFDTPEELIDRLKLNYPAFTDNFFKVDKRKWKQSEDMEKTLLVYPSPLMINHRPQTTLENRL